VDLATITCSKVPAGRHELRFEFEPTDKPDIAHGKGTPGRAQLYIDRQLVGQTDLPVTTPVLFNPGDLSCGANHGSPVIPDYQAPVPVHRHPVQRHRRPQRRSHHRH
jgi:hypothetical protein